MYKDVGPISPNPPGNSSADRPQGELSAPSAPVKSILRRTSSSDGGRKTSWPLTDSRVQPLQDNRSSQDARIVAEVKPLEVKQEKELSEPLPFIKKVRSYTLQWNSNLKVAVDIL